MRCPLLLHRFTVFPLLWWRAAIADLGAMMNPTMTADMARALADARRTPGWNNRNPAIRRFEIGRCTVYVVPARAWAYRRAERDAQAWRERAQA